MQLDHATFQHQSYRFASLIHTVQVHTFFTQQLTSFFLRETQHLGKVAASVLLYQCGLGLLPFVPPTINGKSSFYPIIFSVSSNLHLHVENQKSFTLQLLKLSVLPPWPGYRRFSRRFCLFFFIYFG